MTHRDIEPMSAASYTIWVKMTPSAMSLMNTLCLDSPDHVTSGRLSIPEDTGVLPRSLTFDDDDDSRDSGFESHGSDTEGSPLNCFLSRKTIIDFSSVRKSLFSPKRPRDEDDSPTAKRSRGDDVMCREELYILESPESMKSAVDKMEAEINLIGDGSKAPTITGRHKDLKSVSPRTVSQLLTGKYDDVISGYQIIDCRYPYEYEGGHIEGAINLHNEAQISEVVTSLRGRESTQRNILVFHCEFSSERAPKLLRHLRSLDRKLNSDRYPFLFYPEVYLLDGGYKAFYEQHQRQCQPNTYIPMLHEDYASQLRHFRSKSKSTKTTKNIYLRSRCLEIDVSPLKLSLF
ncbi:M-phase inducer phosphatase 3-like [Haliotis rubra]|uniref:M-phase inducer phosphatase 3-like n=1 Tax=Haliotis rubra TaxID=36100 RepID=UPI001EE5A189|nr:M-phase inducer phosphatase 3-like [Haliotis rubra]